MVRGMDLAGWQERFEELARGHGVPGASLAVLADGQVQALATGVLHTGTGVAATTDSLFQIGSITKVYTATMVMSLVEQGLTTLDTPVIEVLPEFRVADEQVSRQVTLRHLLAHTSGINGDPEIDAGRGDDCLARFVDGCAELTQCHPLGAGFSYCNAGYSILGRVIERLTGTVWDVALRDLLLDPAGLGHTWTLPEDVLRFRAAMGHLKRDGQQQPAPVWTLPRFDGPAGLICSTATDVVNFAKLHLDASLPRVAQMLQPHATVPSMHDGTCPQWGLGWALFDWGRPVYGHDGGTIGQSAVLRVIPDAGVAIALLANTDAIGDFYREVFAELLQTRFGITTPAPLAPPAVPVELELEKYVGVYERLGMRAEVSCQDGHLKTSVARTDVYADLRPPHESELVAVSEGRFLERVPGSTRWVSTVFLTAPDGTDYLYLSLLALRKVQ
jgi:CubicO group peptidase (beta-lactamase class C family)